MSVYLGIDTSNYTTSVAVYDPMRRRMVQRKKLLPVAQGQLGLQQSKALFYQIRQLPAVLESAFLEYGETALTAVGVSSRPRMQPGSYMPVFLAGQAVARSIAVSHNIPCYETAHQNGHVAAALYAAARLDLLERPFLAFHVSGGTTEALLITPDRQQIFRCEVAAKTLDLNAGQVIDRVGGLLGLPFPSGGTLDKLSQNGAQPSGIRPALKGADCCLSGVENRCMAMKQKGVPEADIARFAIEYIYQTVKEMTDRLRQQYGDLPVVYAGGVMRNSLIRERLTRRGGIFCDPEFSSDNAAGVAVLAAISEQRSGI